MRQEHQRKPTSISERVACNFEPPSGPTGSGGGLAAQPQPAGAVVGDAPPSNTASHGYKGELEDKGFRLLRVGVDSLYLSFHGDLFPSLDSELGQLKYLAKSRNPSEKAEAQKQIGKHYFEVLDRGQGSFAYILQDGAYRICVKSAESRALPLAWVKVSADVLAYKLPEQVVDELTLIIQELGETDAMPMVSRIDLFADFVTDTDFNAVPDVAWITQANRLARYIAKQKLTGWTFSAGAALSARLYDKTVEIEQESGKTYLHELWRCNGWNGESTVWRMEFQFKRDVLAAFRVGSFKQIKDKLGSLWQTVTNQWLRLTVPPESDSNRSRWPMHPTWAKIAEIRWRLDDQPLTRQYAHSNVPSDEFLARNSVAVTTSYMAKHNVHDFDEGTVSLQSMAKKIASARCESKLDITFEDWIAREVALKTRQFNARMNTRKPGQEATTPDKVERAAKDYDDESNGA